MRLLDLLMWTAQSKSLLHPVMKCRMYVADIGQTTTSPTTSYTDDGDGIEVPAMLLWADLGMNPHYDSFLRKDAWSTMQSPQNRPMLRRMIRVARNGVKPLVTPGTVVGQPHRWTLYFPQLPSHRRRRAQQQVLMQMEKLQ